MSSRAPRDPRHRRDRREPRGLERILSKAGLCSRTQAREWIASGRVRVNGAVILDPDAWFDPAHDRITVDGRALEAEAGVYIALHKPRGYLCTRRDPAGRPTVYELVHDVGAWVFPVGRLDFDSSGLLLLTNDTRFSDQITRPSSHVQKRYEVIASPRLDETALEALRRGVTLADGPTRPAEVRHIAHRGARSVFEIAITEGKNRQVRRMVREVGGKVETLVRTAIGPLELGDLAAGAWRPLARAERQALERAVRSAEG